MTCPICAEHALVLRLFLSQSPADRWEILEHAHECDILATQVEAGNWQIVGKRAAATLVALALAGVSRPIPVNWIMQEEAVI